jgi:hypothetical protein
MDSCPFDSRFRQLKDGTIFQAAILSLCKSIKVWWIATKIFLPVPKKRILNLQKLFQFVYDLHRESMAAWKMVLSFYCLNLGSNGH